LILAILITISVLPVYISLPVIVVCFFGLFFFITPFSIAVVSGTNFTPVFTSDV